ncbi:hypothetical protein LSM04_001635 [Trypanosoma melophagium]|uniref:uncharacterized protein n=1 Tax=Trypanosoma melophagium TaxID=715481 RepID=UPI00351A5B32|nr:hypothetical protein LSM04_001635 [Trypanosoma melophagium]
MRRIAINASLRRFFWAAQQIQQQRQQQQQQHPQPLLLQKYGLATEHERALPGLVNHCKLLQKIMDTEESDNTRRKRIRGVLKKMEANYMNWLAECGAVECLQLLDTLRKVSPYFKGNRGSPKDAHSSAEWSGASPYFTAQFSDWLCAVLQRAARHASRPEEELALLSAAAELELADTQTLQQLTHKLTSREYAAKASPDDLVRVLRLVSLLVKRCRMPIPPLDHVLCRLPSAKLNSRESLTVLSSLLRLRERHGVDVARAVSRRAIAYVETYTAKDVIFALEAIALLNCCHEAYTGAVLDRCTSLHTQLQPHELGSICKYIAMLDSSRVSNDTALSCAKELRRLLPALLIRTEELLGRFSLRDAQCILKCFERHKLHHSVVFSRLTPLASEN